MRPSGDLLNQVAFAKTSRVCKDASDFEPRLARVPHHVKFSYKVLEAQQMVMYADIPSQSRYMRVKSTTDCAFFAPRLLLCLLSSSLGHLAFLGWQGVNSVFVCL